MASHIGRRKFLATLGGAAGAWPMAARGQHTSVRHIGVLMTGFANGETARFLLDPLRDGLRELGWIEGQNISLDYRFGHGQVDLLPALASQLVQRGVEVIVTEGTPASLAARNASPSVAIVVGASADPVRSGLVASLSRPGGNVTGLSVLGPELAGKRLQLLAQIVPRLARVGALFNPTNPVTSWALEETQSAAPSLDLAIDPRPVRGPDELEAAFVAMNAARPDAFVVMPDGMLYAARARVVRLAAAARLPGLFPEQEVAREGGLMAYGASLPANFRRAASFVDKILRGAKPADLPVEQPTKFELVINLKTAKALGLDVPLHLQQLADEVIE
jgi:putative ABC transport system substrate-binding protein